VCILVTIAQKGKVEIAGGGKAQTIALTKFTKVYKCSDAVHQAVAQVVMSALSEQKIDIYGYVRTHNSHCTIY